MESKDVMTKSLKPLRKASCTWIIQYANVGCCAHRAQPRQVAGGSVVSTRQGARMKKDEATTKFSPSPFAKPALVARGTFHSRHSCLTPALS